MSEEQPRSDERPDDAARRLESILAEHREPDETHNDEAGQVDPLDPFDPFAPARAPETVPTAPGEDADAAAADDLPDAPLFALLRSLEHEIGIDRIDRIWVFPPRRVESGETSVVVVSAFPDIQGDRRRVYAAHYTAREDAREPSLAIDEFGTAPTDRVERLAEEVVERIKDGPPAAPRSHHIDGSDDRWSAVLHELAGSHLDVAQRNPRLR